MIYRTVGPPAVGQAFFNREELLEKILDRIEHSSILLVAPRRFGKTSIMLAARDRLVKEKGVLALYLDVEWISEPSDFITEIIYRLGESKGKDFANWIKGLPKGILDCLKTHIESVEIYDFRVKLRSDLRDEWKEKGREILKRIADSSEDAVLLIDELPLMLFNMRKKLKEHEIAEFLYWLRHLRVDWNIKVIAGGSIGIDHILEDVKAVASINDLERINVGPFDRGIALEFVEELLEKEGIELGNECAEKILEVLGEPIPYFIQVLVSALVDEVRYAKLGKLTPVIVEEVYRKRVLGVECRAYFEHYFQRLSVYYTPLQSDAAKHLLKRLAIKGEMTAKELYGLYADIEKRDDHESFNYLVSNLENDFYIRYDEDKGLYRFSTRILRDLWLRRYEVLD